MSLKINCVHYNPVHLYTVHDLEVFAEDLRVLITTGYNLTVDTSAHISLFCLPHSKEWCGTSHLPPPRYDFTDTKDFKTDPVSPDLQKRDVV